jgi:hypothetical protein
VCGGGAEAGARITVGRKGWFSAMRLLKLVMPLSAGALAAAAFLGCTIGVERRSAPPVTTVPAATSTLTVRWLVSGTTDPGECAAAGADALELVVYDRTGAQVTTANEPCESFSLQLALPEDTYSADATLVDSSSNARSVTKRLDDIDVAAGTDLAIDVDFPASSLL